MLRFLPVVLACVLAAFSCKSDAGGRPTTLTADFVVEAFEPLDTFIFGMNTAIDGDLVIVSDIRNGFNITGPRSVFGFDAETGAPLWQLISPEPDRGFGVAIDCNTDWIAVGTTGSNAGGPNLGAVYVYHRSTRALARIITPIGSEAGGTFGYSLALHGNTLVVGAPFESIIDDDYGAVYVFDISTGEQLVKILPVEPDGRRLFGLSVDVDGTRIAVSSGGSRPDGVRFGAVNLYDAGSFALLRIIPGPTKTGVDFGRSVAIDGDRLVVGAPVDDRWITRGGAIYLFDAASGDLLRIPEPLEVGGNARLGETVGISGNKVIAGARLDDNGTGAVHVFNFHSGKPHHILVSEIAGTEALGYGAAIDGTRVIAGAPGSVAAGSDQRGTAHIFTISGGCSPADLWEPIGALDLGDVTGFVGAFIEQDPIADCNGNGVFELFDLNLFVSGFLQGCP